MNGVIEAICAGVPQYACLSLQYRFKLIVLHRILWPFCADQPLNGVLITEILQIGYELLEVRSGPGLKPIYRNGYQPKGTVEALRAEMYEVLGHAFGKDGGEKRARLEVLRTAVMREWEEGGTSRRDVSAFLDSL